MGSEMCIRDSCKSTKSTINDYSIMTALPSVSRIRHGLGHTVKHRSDMVRNSEIENVLHSGAPRTRGSARHHCKSTKSTKNDYSIMTAPRSISRIRHGFGHNRAATSVDIANIALPNLFLDAVGSPEESDELLGPGHTLGIPWAYLSGENSCPGKECIQGPGFPISYWTLGIPWAYPGLTLGIPIWL